MSRWTHTGLQTADVPDGLSNVPHAARGKLKAPFLTKPSVTHQATSCKHLRYLNSGAPLSFKLALSSQPPVISIIPANTVERSPQLLSPVVNDFEDERTQYDNDIVTHAATECMPHAAALTHARTPTYAAPRSGAIRPIHIRFHPPPKRLPPTHALHTLAPRPAPPPRALFRPHYYGAPKRFVRLVGPPLDLALDVRGASGKGR
ncbi:hypothetical protein K438DRAFT_1991420 [Mycena galopus ATCC 62051]|nr:hypothetical protein K438DRAFT_1991420 [Mycena galopus ATCC 62051]